MRRIVAAAALLGVVSCGGSKDGGTPTNPSPSETRVIRLEANLEFGDVDVGASVDRDLRIYNSGNAPLNVTGVTRPSGYAADWTSGTIQPGASQAVTIRFSPTAEQSYSGTLTVNANHTSGTNTMNVSGRGVFRGPRTQFGDGQFLVGTEIQPGRYFSTPLDSCYWERQRGLGGTLGDVIANEFVGFNALQWIVDILPSDRAFETEDCGTWFKDAVRFGLQSSIRPGVWAVNVQIPPGTYRANTLPGCYWERVRNFQGTLNSIISNDFVSSGGNRFVTIRSGDTGFHSDQDCGEWTRTTSVTEVPAEGDDELSPAAIERNWRLRRQQSGRLQ